ncbi:MAG TPA: class I SAM-dependent methyltransferase [Burkholderiales bacterium]|nr:class I SAM-dependent methyltransferase [Burkholderiales bacterium]
MSRRTWGIDEQVRKYLLDHSLREPPVAAELRAATAKLPYAGMQISPEQGQLMALLVQAIGARRVIEVGTFTGYSALWVALALPADGKLVCCDVSAEWTAVGKPYWAKAGVAGKIDLRIAPAIETLDRLLADAGAGAHDFAFIDADKTGYDGYYERCLRLLRTGGLIAIDNVLWGGDVADPKKRSADTLALRRLNDKLHRDERVSLSMLPVGDGLTLALKR